MTISIINGVNPLQTTLLELGIVSGRVALLLRSAEIQPLFVRFVINSIIDVELKNSSLIIPQLNQTPTSCKESATRARVHTPLHGFIQGENLL